MQMQYDSYLFKLNESKRGNIINIIASDPNIFYLLGDAFNKKGKLNDGEWILLQNQPAEYEQQRKQRIRYLLSKLTTATIDDLIGTINEINYPQQAELISDELNLGTKYTNKESIKANQEKNNRNYERVADILTDEDNFGLIIMNLYLQLEKLWPQSVERFIESNININIDQNTIQQKTMKGKFYLESIRNVKLADFLSNLDAIGCSSVKDIDEKLQQLNATIVHKKKATFSGKNEVANWCNNNNLSNLFNKLIDLGFDSLEKLKQLDDQSCTEMDIRGFTRIELMNKIKLLK